MGRSRRKALSAASVGSVWHITHLFTTGALSDCCGSFYQGSKPFHHRGRRETQRNSSDMGDTKDPLTSQVRGSHLSQLRETWGSPVVAEARKRGTPVTERLGVNRKYITKELPLGQ